MKLALFDLDHTLIPFDSGMAWTRFLVERGVLPPEAEAQYLATASSTWPARSTSTRCTAPASRRCARFTRAQLARGRASSRPQMAPRVPAVDARARCAAPATRATCARIVTATTRLIAEPFGRLFGIADVLATEAATVDGGPTPPSPARSTASPAFASTR